VRLVGFIIGIYHDARSHERHDARSHERHDALSHERQINEKIKFVLEQAMKTQRGSRGIALLFL
jgi:hypothetical protein